MHLNHCNGGSSHIRNGAAARPLIQNWLTHFRLGSRLHAQGWDMRHAIVRVFAGVMFVSGAPAIAAAQSEKGTIAVGYAALQQPDRRIQCWRD